jgi:hypothetical protein
MPLFLLNVLTYRISKKDCFCFNVIILKILHLYVFFFSVFTTAAILFYEYMDKWITDKGRNRVS